MYRPLKILNSPVNVTVVLSVIIVNYNVKYFLEQCLFSVLKAGVGSTVEIIVIDNHSSDGSRSYLEPVFPEVKFYWLDSNAGFASACNYGVKQSTGEYILFLNPDTIVPEDCFERSLHFFESTANAGALGVRMIDGSGNFLRESKRGFPSLTAAFFKLAGLAYLFPRSPLFAKYYFGNTGEHTIQETEILAGAFIMIKKSVLEITGGFDEAFFMYGEDIDLSYRVLQSGYTNYYFPEVTIVHFKGESTHKGRMDYIRVFYGAMKIFVNKHYKKSNVVIYNFCIRMAVIVRGCLAAFYRAGVWISGKLKEALRNSGSRNSIPETIIAGSADEYNSILQILEKAGTEKKIKGRIAIGDQENAALGEQLAATIKNNSMLEIIFCEGHLSFAEIIQHIQRLPKGVQIKFHAQNSNSIAGSNSKNSRGETIPAR